MLMKSALEEIEGIRKELLSAREGMDIDHPNYQTLLNLRQYLILRSKDRMKLQDKLFLMSLSSLGRSYAHVAGSIDTLYEQLCTSLGEARLDEKIVAQMQHLSISDAIAFASQNSVALFGGKMRSKLSQQSTAIMVTLPSHAADNNGELIYALAAKGVNVFRINTAHDDAEVWKMMADIITTINQERDDESKIKIFVDLAGPKIRTGKIRQRDLPVGIGSNKQEKIVEIFTDELMHTQAEYVDERTQLKIPARLCVSTHFFKKMKVDHLVKIIDMNGKKASIRIEKIEKGYAKGKIDKKVYLDATSKIFRKHEEGHLLNIATQVEPIRLFRGDLLTITERDELGRAAQYASDGKLLEPALINCSFHGVIARIKEGDKVFIDDGKIGLEVVNCSEKSITCKVIQAKAGGTLLKEEKGINFPDTPVKTAALTELDRRNMLSVIDYADSVSISFCQSSEDIHALQELLTLNERTDIGIIAKIETRLGVHNMPEILEALLRWQKSGVMIARGDLAIEVGFVQMAQIQEALLDICNAAHMPVIWATQVLESQMKNNLPSRAEVTDAAMSGRAECVMLNKGAFATDTIDVLIQILDEMHFMFKKNRQLLKKETLWSIK